MVTFHKNPYPFTLLHLQFRISVSFRNKSKSCISEAAIEKVNILLPIITTNFSVLRRTHVIINNI